MIDEIDKNDLPESLALYIDSIGLDATMKIVNRWGGRRFYVPGNITHDHPIAQLIGMDAARALMELQINGEVPVPRAAAALRAARDRMIFKRHYDRGDSLATLAGDYQMTEQGICLALRRVARAKGVVDPQITLFD